MRSLKVNDNMHGILWMILACIFAALMVNIVRHLTTTIHPFFVVFLRNATSLVFILPLVVHRGRVLFQTKKLHLYSMRTIIGLSAMTMWFYALSLVPLAQATALSFTAPLITSIAAILFFKEKSSAARWFALLLGFAGTIVILRPGLEGFNKYSLFVLVAATFWGFNGLLIKKLSKTEPATAMVFYMVLLMTPLSLPAAMPHFKMLDANEFYWVCLLGIVANLFQISLAKAFSRTELTVVLPFDFLRLIFVSLIAWLAFNERIDLYTIIGGLMIIGSTFFMAYKEAKAKKHFTEETIKRTNV